MTQTITPYLLYDDAGEALNFLSSAFGFVEARRNTSSDGQVSHAEMRFRGGEIHLGQPLRPSSPRSYGGARPYCSTCTSTTWTSTAHRREQLAQKSSMSPQIRTTASVAITAVISKGTRGTSPNHFVGDPTLVSR
jgi:uncharacterized glyoxalase superfamily protein PhnB